MPREGSQLATQTARIGSPDRMTRQRWVICALLFFATVIAYVDRSVISNLKTTLEGVIPGLDDLTYGFITAAFQMAYGIAMLVAGGLTDKLGTRKAFAIAICLWSVAAMLPGAAFSVVSFAIAMFLLGLGEAANFPACIKTVAEWFPKRERATATGLFNSGANVGNIDRAGAGCGAGAVCLLARHVRRRRLPWIRLAVLLARHLPPARGASQRLPGRTRTHPQRSRREDRERSLEPRAPVQGNLGLRHRQVPHRSHLVVLPCSGFRGYLQIDFPPESVSKAACRSMLAYSISIIGSVAGGMLSSVMIARGMSANVARKTHLADLRIADPPIFAAPFVHHLWVVVALLGMATAGHQGWSATLFTLPSDMFPKAAVASVTGIGGMCGAAGGVMLLLSAGAIVHITHSFVTLFVIACVAYPAAWLIIHAITPNLAPAQIE